MPTLQSATYLVSDYDEAIAFFVTALGFVLREDEARANGSRRVVVGPEDPASTGLVLALSESDVRGRQAGGKVAFFLETDDFAGLHARMLTAGVTFREEPRYEAYGTVAVFEDPWGMPWDLIQPPAAASGQEAGLSE